MDWDELSPFFKPNELCSPQVLEQYPGIISVSFVSLLNNFRRHLGVPLIVNTRHLKYRGFTTVEESRGVRGRARETFHAKGRAVDVSSPEMPLERLLEAVRAYSGFGGIGVYRTWLHLDDRFTESGESVVWGSI